MKPVCLLLLLLLAACSPSPPPAQLAHDLQQRLDRDFGERRLVVETLDRLGSAPDRMAPAQRVVYFRVALRLGQPYDFGAWRTHNVARLAELIGCGPRGLYGVRAGGNWAGDTLRAFGRISYRRAGKGWQVVATPVAERAMPPAGRPVPPDTVERLTHALSTAVHALSGPARPASDRIVEEELGSALQNIENRLARLQQGLALASGERGGEYWRIGEAMATVRGSAPAVVNIATSGSVANLELLDDGTVGVAIVQADVLLAAARGEGVFSGRRPDGGLRLLARLYPEAVHVIVRDGLPVYRIADLRQRRVAIGSTDSGARQTVVEVLRRHGLTAANGLKAESMALRDALTLFAAGRLDAIIHTIGVPSADLAVLARSQRIRLLPLDDAVIEAMRRDNPVYLAFSIPADSYDGQRQAVATLAVPALLVARDTLSGDAVQRVLDLLYRQADFAALGSRQGAWIPRDAAGQAGGPVPMHVAAVPAVEGPP